MTKEIVLTIKFGYTTQYTARFWLDKERVLDQFGLTKPDELEARVRAFIQTTVEAIIPRNSPPHSTDYYAEELCKRHVNLLKAVEVLDDFDEGVRCTP